MLFLENKDTALSREAIAAMIRSHVEANAWKSVLLLPPDITRSHSGAGWITAQYYRELKKKGAEVRVMPALGTHMPMTREECVHMFGEEIPEEAYLVHDFRRSVGPIGSVPAEVMEEISQGLFHEEVAVSVNRELTSGKYDALISIGQVIPHEVAGMASYSKNILVGCGGGDLINASHFLGVYYGLENLLGRDHNPVRDLFDYIQVRLLDKLLPLTFVQTVMVSVNGEDTYRGVYIGRDRQPFEAAVALSQQVNFTVLDRPVHTCVVWMDPESYHSTWVTNKAIYRTELAVEKGGEIIVIAPGVHTFGENDLADSIIRRYGYLSREEVLRLKETEPALAENLSMAGHLIHGTADGIRITYCTDRLSREEVEGVHYGYMTVEEALKAFPCEEWKTGWHRAADGREIYFVRNAALGMWRAERKETAE